MIQRLIDALAYPPTMQYQVDGLVPIGPLTERVKCIESVAPTLFQGRRFLDVGASKGYFSLLAAHGMASVIAIEPGKEAGDILDMVMPGRVYHGDFRSYPPASRFDRAFLGNVYHHIGAASGGNGYEWVAKLAALMDDGGLVVIEGPTECSTDCWQWPEQNLMDAMRPWFTLDASGPTTSYTPGRKVWAFTRREREYVAGPSLGRSVRRGFVNNNGEEKPWVWVNDEDGVCWKTFKGPIPVARQISLEVAASSPRGTSILRWAVDATGQPVGWATPSIGDKRVLGYYQAEHQVWRAYAEHNVYLARIGFVDLDPGGINWFMDPDVDWLRTFDKSAVVPIKTMTEHQIDCWGICASRGYRTIDATWGGYVMAALSTRDPAVVQRTFEEFAK